MAAEATLGNILVVDDEEYITELLKCNLEAERYAVTVVEQAVRAHDLDLPAFQLVIVDAMNQAYNGLALLRDLKGHPQTAHMPVIFLCSADECMIDAFDCGADDYVLKPFSLRELMARIRAVLRRTTGVLSARSSSTALRLRGGLEVDLLGRQVRDGDAMLPLTKTEYAILALLAQNKNRFFNRAQIYSHVWPDPGMPSTNDRIVDTNISRLRKKLGDHAGCIVNKTGQGYAIVD